MWWRSPARRARRARQRDAAQEQAYAAELAPIDPKLPEQFAAATRLMDDGKTEEAASAFSKLAAAAPRHAPTLWRLSAMARVTGHRDDAIASARAAVAATDRWQAQSTLAEALMFGGTSRRDLEEAQTLVGELRRVHPGEDSNLLAAELAMQRNDVQALRLLVAEMDGQPSDGPGPDYFRFVLAVRTNAGAWRTKPCPAPSPTGSRPMRQKSCGRSPASRRTCGRCSGPRSAASRSPCGWAGCC